LIENCNKNIQIYVADKRKRTPTSDKKEQGAREVEVVDHRRQLHVKQQNMIDINHVLVV
jgi:hypothetical protein